MAETKINNQIEIKEGSVENAQELEDIFRRADAKRTDNSCPVPQLDQDLAKKDSWVKMAIKDGKIVGFISGEPTVIDDKPVEGFEHIKSVAVDPDYWGQGIGGKLLDQALESLKQNDRTGAELWTHETNERAQKLYESRGFKKTGDKKPSERTGEPIIHYSLEF